LSGFQAAFPDQVRDDWNDENQQGKHRRAEIKILAGQELMD
jgi:hypothetical protein